MWTRADGGYALHPHSDWRPEGHRGRWPHRSLDGWQDDRRGACGVRAFSKTEPCQEQQVRRLVTGFSVHCANRLLCQYA